MRFLMYRVLTPLSIRHKRKYSVLYVAVEGSPLPSLRPLWFISEPVYLQLQHQQHHINQNVFYLERVHVVSVALVKNGSSQKNGC